MKPETEEYIRELHAKEVVSKMKRITVIHSEIDYFTEHGRIMPNKGLTLKQVIADLSIGEILRMKDNLPPLISKWKTKLKAMPDGPKKEQLKINLALKESELAQINKLKDEAI